ncbi:MAG: 5-formyltetrahydrofolate cyclo-ligase [Frankiaceae bacterium]|nr:5-formyltetrahydrofolate cyclo-ligase [Frankiaceae bacterium]
MLRSRLLSARASRSQDERVAAGGALARHGAPAWTGLTTVAAYAAFGTEPPTRPLLDALTDAGVRVLLPIVDGDDVDWGGYEGWDRLVPHGRLGLLEPAGTRLGPAALRAVDVIVVPALAVDRAGHRLGRGAGHYDRALAATAVPRVAVVYDDEVLDTIPSEAHDVLMGDALCPSGFVPLGGG